uniref:Uncharacterized protein AlNc14C4G572 n=1 Tax=Albugo laibachii Nc14 TaxID=890382 RepID=F0W0C9_9STRA|nr:conserved hypothetical protein [Albugo laibachii Nc14]|eukprot:CCA14501.1 conserved hypothetical protein [Albugo laibachii Nc14]
MSYTSLLSGCCTFAAGLAVYHFCSIYLMNSISNDTTRRRLRDELVQLELDKTQLKNELQKQKELRQQERTGRTSAERKLCLRIQEVQAKTGYRFHAIANVDSCFSDRRGTPRQGHLVPSSRAIIRFQRSVPPASLECLDEFSHIWVLFTFHGNTNLSKQDGAANSFTAKIAPPRLGGMKVGVLSTRSPHRPNSLGLSLVKIENVCVTKREISVSGHDLVHQTPVLDIKPYIPADCKPDFRCPTWVSESGVDCPVVFAPVALEALRAIMDARRCRFYDKLADAQDAIKQMLVLDIRSVHQGRGRRNEHEYNKTNEQDVPVFNCRFDNLELRFKTFADQIRIIDCHITPPSS